jgi:Zn-dependent peptidase ImmA (M78 family)
MASFNVQVLTWDRLRRIAEGYLAKVHPSSTIPIPIEEIVDNIEKIDVVPIEELSVDGREAYTARDKRTIYVDKGVYSHKVPFRLRYTLAHELSHILIHPYVFDAADYETIQEFKKFLGSIPPEDLRTIESQAYRLAGLLLVPSPDLSREYLEVAGTLRENGLDIAKLASESLRQVAKVIGGRFQVSSNVIHRCAVRDGLWAWDDIEGL